MTASRGVATRSTEVVARRYVTVGQLVARLQVGLQETFPRRFWLEGEVTGFKVVRGGHAFFALKEEKAQVEAVIWRTQVERLSFTPEDGALVLALVRAVDFYAPSGRLRLQIEAIEPQGIGALAKALEERRARLLAEGLFEVSRKKPVPFLPRVIGIATAARSAALHDILEILRQRFPERRMLVRPCRVQGEGAGDDIAAALDELNREGSADVILLARGGGSMEDLWCFNEEAVVRAIARSRIPIIAGIGHEVDTTLADLAADVRAATPTAAAQRCLPERAEIEARLTALDGRLRSGLAGRVELARARLRACEAALGDPRTAVAQQRFRLEAAGSRLRESLAHLLPRWQRRLDGMAARLGARLPRTDLRRTRLDLLAGRLRASMSTRVERARAGLGAHAARVEALSPLAVLARGFAVARRADGSIVREAATLTAGQELDLRFARGSAQARVERVEGGDEPGPPALGGRSRSRTKKGRS